LTLAIAGDQLYVASGSAIMKGAGPVHIDLTKPNPTMPEYLYFGRLLRVPMTVPPNALVERKAYVQVAKVWFDATTTMQDANNAVRWIEELEDAIVPEVRAGTLGLELVAFLDRVDETTARARAQVVEAAIRERLGGAPRITTKVSPPSGYRGDVGIVIDPADLVARMKPE
jgi:hypothetical protein